MIIVGIETQHVTWGIQPAWAKRILINTQSETMATKKAFAAPTMPDPARLLV
jgi:putative SOS response-associated peptidase YedK|tara:strand:- start:30306 stop:30461 length:156 start_codon:yes stop_codon:yes gene_type:complete